MASGIMIRINYKGAIEIMNAGSNRVIYSDSEMTKLVYVVRNGMEW